MSGLRRGTPALAALTMALLAACAPDAWVYNKKASGFNGYLDTVTAQCQPLWIGQMQLTTFDASAAPGQGGNFDMLLDLSSRLYYNRMSPAAFRDAVRTQFMAESDPRTNRSIDCMIAQLPSDRPTNPPGAVIKAP
jgi:hypothetical protein